MGRVTSKASAAMPRAVPREEILKRMCHLDRAALEFWFSLTPKERERSTMRPDAPLERFTRLGGIVTE